MLVVIVRIVVVVVSASVASVIFVIMLLSACMCIPVLLSDLQQGQPQTMISLLGPEFHMLLIRAGVPPVSGTSWMSASDGVLRREQGFCDAQGASLLVALASMCAARSSDSKAQPLSEERNHILHVFFQATATRAGRFVS